MLPHVAMSPRSLSQLPTSHPTVSGLAVVSERAWLSFRAMERPGPGIWPERQRGGTAAASRLSRLDRLPVVASKAGCGHVR